MKLKKLNSLTVSPVLTNEVEYTKKNLKSFDIIPSLYYNMFICSKKKSGKTSLINSILTNATSKKTTIWLFCPTYQVDNTWKTMIRNFNEKGYTINTFSSLKEGKMNILDNIIEDLSKSKDEDENDDLHKKKKSKVDDPVKPVITRQFCLFENDDLEEIEDNAIIEMEGSITLKQAKRKRRTKKLTPENLFIFDDISTELRHPSLARILKVHRHLKASVIISSQYLHDLKPASILQLDYFICFKSFSLEKLEYIHKMLDLSVSFEDFWKLYKFSTADKYHFLYADVRREIFRKNLNELIELKHNDE